MKRILLILALLLWTSSVADAAWTPYRDQILLESRLKFNLPKHTISVDETLSEKGVSGAFYPATMHIAIAEEYVRPGPNNYLRAILYHEWAHLLQQMAGVPFDEKEAWDFARCFGADRRASPACRAAYALVYRVRASLGLTPSLFQPCNGKDVCAQ